MEAKGITGLFSNTNSKPLHRRWDMYIEAMRGPLSSVPVDPHKKAVLFARRRAEARFFEGCDQYSVNRSAFHLTKMLKRQTG